MESKNKKPESYKKIRELGKGACGKAYLVKCEKSGESAVIKQIDINSIKSREEREKVYQVRKFIISSFGLVVFSHSLYYSSHD
jgi:serine/threonine protein kinase